MSGGQEAEGCHEFGFVWCECIHCGEALVPAAVYGVCFWLRNKGLSGGEGQGAIAEPEAAEPPSGGDFTLHSKDGPVSLHDFKGKVVLLFFGYASCPDICPTSLAFSTKALNTLNEDELAQVQPLFVSIDPQRDSVDKMAEFVSFFHPGFIGLTGS